jgi:hypothetical protein
MSRTVSNGRGWAYVGAILGGAVSIAANVAHSYVPPTDAPADWAPHVGAVVGAVFWPVALFVAVEILARVAWPEGRGWALLRFGGLLPVAAVAALVSYKHLAGLLAFYGEDGLTATLGPLAVDGLMVMATGALLATGARTTTSTAVVAEGVVDDNTPALTSDEGTHSAGAPALASAEGNRGDIPTDDVGSTDPTEGVASTDTPDPWQYAVPVATVAETATVERDVHTVDTPEPVRRKRVTPRSLTAAERVTAAHAKEPQATHERIAKVADVSVSTVKRHRPTSSPSLPAPAETRTNGHSFDLTGVAL